MEVLITASFITAFVAGMAALFAPCCITVLLPTYFASAFRQKGTVVAMTFVFSLGLVAVFLPLGLGIAALGQFFSAYHDTLYSIGGVFLLALGAFILLGKHYSLPFTPRVNTGGKIEGTGSVFALGLFSGFATLCCAPVLAGALALSALPGSIFLGGLYSLVYALGMMAPLIILAYFADRKDLAKKVWVFKKRIEYKLGGAPISLTIAELVSGAMFLGIGALILYLAATGRLAAHSAYQMEVNIYMANLNQYLTRNLDWVLPAAGVLALAALAPAAIRMLKGKGFIGK